jgi:hypothetical protein
MMPVIVIDVNLLAVPNRANSAQDAEEVFAAINAWAAAAERQNCCRMAICSDAIEVLAAANCFPATHHIQALLELFGLGHVFSARDINARIFSLLSRVERLVNVFGAEVVEVANGLSNEINFSGAPDHSLNKSIQAALATVLLIDEPQIVRVVLGVAKNRSSLNYACDIALLDRLAHGREVITPAKHVEGIIRTVESPKEFLGSLDAAAVWERAEDGLQIHMAICIQVAQLAAYELEFLPPVLGSMFCVGNGFFASLERNQAAYADRYAGRALEKCARLVLGMSEGDISSFGEARQADSAVSYRVHVSKRGVGLRLMFWRRQSGVIELANIGSKHELVIDSGDHEQTIVAQFAR